MDLEGTADAGGQPPADGMPREQIGVTRMGNIGTERREVEFEPLPAEPQQEPDRRTQQEQPEPAPAST
jgi:hypothetical protein